MKKIIILVSCVIFITVPLVHAKKPKLNTCVVNANEWAGVIPATDTADSMILRGLKPVEGGVGIHTDAGYFGPS